MLQQQSDTLAGAEGRLQTAAGQFDWRADAGGGWQQFYTRQPSANGGRLTPSTQIISGYFYSADVAREFRNGVQVAPGFIAYPGTTPAQTGLQPSRGPCSAW